MSDMSGFDGFVAETYSYVSPEARDTMRDGFVGGLLYAAEHLRKAAATAHDKQTADTLAAHAGILEAETFRTR